MAVLQKEATPGAAAKMEGGHLRVPGIDMNSQIRDSGDGSYTMTAWIKPDSLMVIDSSLVRLAREFTMVSEIMHSSTKHTGVLTLMVTPTSILLVYYH